ncbi:MAG: hypothetical protein B7Z74_03650, partial [Deltaproteobacteria bacterium 21-66-5]
MEPDLFAASPSGDVLSVTELTGRIKRLLESSFRTVRVEGEVSNYKRYEASGHRYFSLKDEGAQIRVVLFRGNERNIYGEIRDGQTVIVTGSLGVFEKKGEYQIYARSAEVRGVLGAFAHDEASQTASSVALRPQCPRPAGPDWQVVSSIAFSSFRKWSGLAFTAHGWWVLGAPEILLERVDQSAEMLESVRALARQGKRVLALASSKEPLNASAEAPLPLVLKAEAFVVLSERVREDVATTIGYFAQQGVAVKVISGDHAETVQAVARAASLPPGHDAIDARTLPTEVGDLGALVERNSLFGRVTPAQKRQMVRALQERGHVVGMIGDGVNDVLAIKVADFGIALRSGSAATRAVAQLILTNDSFAALPSVIAEGRQVIANV